MPAGGLDNSGLPCSEARHGREGDIPPGFEKAPIKRIFSLLLSLFSARDHTEKTRHIPGRPSSLWLTVPFRT